MKKNLRIVSAAAAALLTVAPVAASTVSTVSADVLSGGADNTPVSVEKATNISASLVASNTDALVGGKNTASEVRYTLSSSLGNFPSDVKDNIVVVSDADATKQYSVNDKKTKLPAGKYHLAVTGNTVTLSGLDNKKAYTVNGENPNKEAGNSGVNANTNGLLTVSAEKFKSASFRIKDGSKKGTPYVTQNNKTVKAINVTAPKNNITEIVKKVTKGSGLAFAVTDYSTSQASVDEDAFKADFEAALRKSLTDNKVTIDKDGNFTAPAAPLTVNTKVKANNGNSSDFAVTVKFVKSNSSTDENAPQIWYGDTRVEGSVNVGSTTGAAWDYIPLNSTVNTSSFVNGDNYFTATVRRGKYNSSSKTWDTSHTDTRVDVSFDTSKVNTKVAGTYPVTVTAVNPAGKKTTVTFSLHVGKRGASYKKVQSGSDSVPVYDIEGNTVTVDKDLSVKNGDVIATFGEPVKVGDVSYTQINDSDSTKYIETKFIDGSYVPETATSKKVMHAAYVYDKDGKRVGSQKLASYSNVQVVGDPITLTNGKKAYKIAGKDNQYVIASNIDGVKKTLKHNAYVYKTSKKHSKKSMKKGSVVTVYGGSYKFKDGKRYYRIGENKQYIKVANF